MNNTNFDKYDLISFDVFDTLITRASATPCGIFKILSHKMLSSDVYKDFPSELKENFDIIRHEVEIFSQEQELYFYSSRETSFDIIYDLIKTNYNLTDEQVKTLKDLEFQTEFDNILPITKNINLLKSLVEQNKQVVLITDMYYSEDVVKSFLLKFDEVFKNIKIYSSSDYKETKRNRTLYNIVKQDFPDKKWVHIGDNEFSDVLCSRWSGINSLKYKFPLLKKYEKFLLNKTNDYKTSLTVGVARYLRLTNENKKYQFGCSFAAPVLYNYVKWILKSSLNRGINDIYFVARDGYILKIIADIIIEKLNLTIKTHYFYSSRIASRIITSDNYSSYIDNIFNELSNSLSVDFILKRLSLPKDLLLNIDDFSTKKLEIFKIKYLKDQLCKNNALKDAVLEQNKLKSDNFLKYLQQELSGAGKIAFADINGSGRTQDCIADMIKPFYDKTVYNFYLHNQVNMQQKYNSVKLSYLQTAHYISAWVELLCRTPDGQTTGYKVEDDTILPVKLYENDENIIKWGYEEYLQGIKDYTNKIIDVELKNNIDITTVELFTLYFDFVNTNIDKETADILGSIPFSLYNDKQKMCQSAPKMSLFVFLFKKSIFPFISIARCSYFMRIFWKVLHKICSVTSYGYISKKRNLFYLKIFKFKINISFLFK